MEMVRVNEDRIEAIARAFAEAGVDRVLRLEESDPQLHAVRRVAEARGTGFAAVTAVLTALVSYRLTMRGEEWWTCYAETLSRGRGRGSLTDAYREVKAFLESCPGARVQRKAKQARIDKASHKARQALERLYHDPAQILSGASWLTAQLAKALGQKPWRKTIVFSAKMAYYAARTTTDPTPAPWDVPIPVDLRIACVSASSGLVDAPSYKLLLQRPLPVIEAWNRVAEYSGIPPLNLDSVLWLVGWALRDLPLEEARRVIRDRLKPYLGGSSDSIARELAYRPCPRR